MTEIMLCLFCRWERPNRKGEIDNTEERRILGAVSLSRPEEIGVTCETDHACCGNSLPTVTGETVG